MITVEEFIEKFMEDDEVYLPTSALVYKDESIEHKFVVYTKVFKHFGQFFEVTTSRDNTGYWGDGEKYPPIVTEVFPKEVTTTIYVENK